MTEHTAGPWATQPSQDYQKLLKDLDRLTRVAEAGALATLKLEDKVEMHRLIKVMKSARRDLLKYFYVFEDAERMANDD